MPYKDLEKRREKQKEYYEKNKDQISEKNKEYYEKNKEKKKKYDIKYNEKNKEKRKEYSAQRYEDHKQHAMDSIVSGEIIDQYKWDMMCGIIKRCAKQKKHPYSEDFTDDIIFEMMNRGCFYCGDIATTIDRLDSKLNHTLDNCVGSCHGCNNSKGAADPDTFIKKAYYRARKKYYDDDVDIWFVYNTKPRVVDYRMRAKKKGVPFDLTNKYFGDLMKTDCAYCKRTPITWFGIDRVIPSLGYVVGNTVSCCFDCNLDKLEDDVDTMSARNERIAERMDACTITIVDCEKVILHIGAQTTTKKVCAYGKVYESKINASRSRKMSDRYVYECIHAEIRSDDIFEITNEFYEEHKDSELYITKDMFTSFEHFYVNE